MIKYRFGKRNYNLLLLNLNNNLFVSNTDSTH